ncbi:MAG TPA: helix-turn-helix domain-containing protein [Rhizomicrobium sp.]
MQIDQTSADTRRAAIASRKESPFLTTAEAAVYTNTSERTLERMRRKGGGPPFRSHGRPIRYHIRDLDAWSESQRRT